MTWLNSYFTILSGGKKDGGNNINSMTSKCKKKIIESGECTKMLIEFPNGRGKIIGLRMILFFGKLIIVFQVLYKRMSFFYNQRKKRHRKSCINRKDDLFKHLLYFPFRAVILHWHKAGYWLRIDKSSFSKTENWWRQPLSRTVAQKRRPVFWEIGWERGRPQVGILP